MALPNLSHADLEKLKMFINFVSSNPTVLNLPQLEFVKQLIEQFGGKVPAGEFKTGGKCPFGGDAAAGDVGGMKTESNAEEEPEDESEPESEVELDMEVDSLSYFAPMSTNQNTVFIEERQTYKNRRKSKSQPCESPFGEEVYELNAANVCKAELMADPIDTELKAETEAAAHEQSSAGESRVDSGADKSDGDSDGNELQELKPKKRKSGKSKTKKTKAKVKQKLRPRRKCKQPKDEEYRCESSTDNSDDEDNGDDNTSKKRASYCGREARQCRMATRRSGRLPLSGPLIIGRKRPKNPRPINCPPRCRYNCGEKIEEPQRHELCKKFWELDYVGRKNYLLKLVEKRPMGRMQLFKPRKREQRSFTRNYYLFNADGEREQVCVSFFESTLCISSALLKETFQNSDGQGHYLGVDKRGGSGAGRRSNLIDLERTNKESVLGIATDVEKEIESTQIPTEQFSNASEQAPIVPEQTTSAPENADNVPMPAANAPDQPPVAPVQTATAPTDSKPAESGLSASLTDLKTLVQHKPPPKKPTDYRNRKVPPRVRAPQPVYCERRCLWKCTSQFTEEQRKQMCAAFWSLDFKRRKDFVLSRIETRDVLSMTAVEHRKTNRATRSHTNRYFFRGPNGENMRVCADFFMKTLCIARHFIDHAQKYADRQTGMFFGEDRRGKHPPKHKVPDEVLEDIKRHISSYPTWVPHKKYKTRFLHSSLSISKLYAEYKKACEEENRRVASSHFFRNVFHKEFRLAFLRPTSKHGHKVSPQKKDIKSDSKVMRIYANISDFTGDEGGFWIHPNEDNKEPAEMEQPCSDAPRQNSLPQQSCAVSDVFAAASSQLLANRSIVQQSTELPMQSLYLPPAPQIHNVTPMFYTNANNYLSQQQHLASGGSYNDQPHSSNLQFL